jgi:hypothetical protein
MEKGIQLLRVHLGFPWSLSHNLYRAGIIILFFLSIIIQAGFQFKQVCRSVSSIFSISKVTA